MDGRTVQLSYNVVGQLCEVATQTSGCGTSGSPFATGFTYNAAGQLTGFNYGNGVAGTFSYSLARSQLSALSFTRASQTLFGLSYFYQYDPSSCPAGTPENDGQIQCIVDVSSTSLTPGAQGRTVNYTYDALGRLNTAATTGSSNFSQWGLAMEAHRLNQVRPQSIATITA